MRALPCLPITPLAFAPFGTLVDSTGATSELINAGTTRRYADLASLDLCGDDKDKDKDSDPRLHLYVASARTFPLQLERLERHRQGSQVFIPMNWQSFVIVVAPGLDEPEWDAMQAFATHPGQIIALKRGCWHHGLVALNEGDQFAVIETALYRSDTEERTAKEPIFLAAPGKCNTHTLGPGINQRGD
jgi:ureidoglycolate lyase